MTRRRKPKRKRKPKPKKPSYVPEPEVPPEVADRMAVVLMVLSEELTVTEGAERLGLSRVRMQTLKNRAAGAMVQAVAKQPGGCPPKDETTKLREQLEELEAHNDLLQREMAIAEDTMANLVDMIREQGAENRAVQRKSRSRTRRKKTTESSPGDDEASLRLARARHLAALGLPRRAAARAIASRKTLRRWDERAAADERLVRKRGPNNRPPPSPQLRARAEEVARTMNGQIAVDALSKAVPGLSRRDAAVIRDAVRTELERERQQRCGRVAVAAPGVLRGMDAMHLRTDHGRAFALIASDGAVPYRTHAEVTDRYDTDAVEAMVLRDFDAGGLPLVYRLDRASSQNNPRLHGLLQAHGVLHLHGPPRHPQYYGQLERQNREHRNHLGDEPLPRAEVPARLESMRFALNEVLPRRSLGWCTAAHLWSARPALDIDRQALLEQVQDRAQRLQRAARDPMDPSLAWRLAVELTLVHHDLLKLQPGKRC